MAPRDPFLHLDELIGRATERISTIKSENYKLAGKVRELEADALRLMEELEAKSTDGPKVAELEEKVSRLEREREEVRKKVEAASARLRKLLAAAAEEGPAQADIADEAAEAESAGDEVVADAEA